MKKPSGFARDAAYSVFEALRPSADQTLDRAAFATYSLDLVAVAALVLSIGRAGEQELEAGPLNLVDALAETAPRIDIVYQKDRLKPTARHHGILQVLDRHLHAVAVPRGASFHPKLALARYLGPRRSVVWKLWIGSRNLTGGQDREAGLLLAGHLSGTGRKTPSVARMAADLLAPVAWALELASELASVRWRAPDNVGFRALHWRKAGETKPFRTGVRGAWRTVAISPFVDDHGCEALEGGGSALLLTTDTAAAELKQMSDLVVHTLSPPTFGPEIPLEAPAVDDAAPPEPGGLHAKLILRRMADADRLWIGSANLTRRGMEGPNAEVMVELDVPEAVAEDLVTFAEDGVPFGNWGLVDPEATSLRAAERALDDAIDFVVGAEMMLVRSEDGLKLQSAINFDRFLSAHSLKAWLMTRHDAVCVWPKGERTILLVPGGVPLKLETVLVCFHAERLQQDCPPRTWAQAVPFPGHDPDARDRAATAAYIGLAGASAWLRAQLEGIVAPEPMTWTGARRWDGSAFAGAEDELPLALEEVLGAWARNPEAFEARSEPLEATLAALRAELAGTPVETRDDAAIARFEEIAQLWQAIRTAIDAAA